MKLIYQATSGNVIGVVEAPETIDPSKPLGEQYMVKIGVFDPRRSLPEKDARNVIRRLRRFVLRLLNRNPA